MTVTVGPITVADKALRSGAARAALHRRDVAAVLRLAQEHTGASQHRLAAAVGVSQGRLSEILSGARAVTAFEVFERIADGLSMPDHALIALGLVPRQPGENAATGHATGEIADVFSNWADATHDIRATARDASNLQVLAGRGAGLIAHEDDWLREILPALARPPASRSCSATQTPRPPLNAPRTSASRPSRTPPAYGCR